MNERGVPARAWQGTLALVMFAMLVLQGQAYAQDQVASASLGVGPVIDAGPTWATDVAPIVFDNCVQCHRPEGIGPMSLLDYQTAWRYASRIRAEVASRNMPPWHIDRGVGIQEYKNDTSLSDTQVETILQWADAGAPEGDPSRTPAQPDLPDPSQWQLEETLGPPDFVVSAPAYTVVPNAMDQWTNPTTEFNGVIDSPRYVRATELKGSYPDGVRVLHHGHANFQMVGEDGEEFSRPMGRQGVGKGGDLFPENTGMLITPEGEVSWGLHFFPIDRPVTAVAEAAVWLYPEGFVPEHETTGEVQFRVDRNGDRRDTLIPPNSIRALQGVRVLDRAAVLSSVRPHMHMRGKEQSIEAVYPDGRREMLTKVDNYNHFWQISYQYEEDARPLLPKGTVLLMTTVWDNTSANPINPDPDQWVSWGQRGVDEMSHVWVGFTYLSDEEYESMVAERTRMAADQ